jgi:hypothetical protein
MRNVRARSLGIVIFGACVLVAVAGNARAATMPGHTAVPFEYTAPKAGSRALFALSRYPTSLVQVDHSAATTALLRSHGATLAVPQMNVWRLPTGTAQALTPQLERTGALSVIEPERKLSFFGHLDLPSDLLQGDPLIPQEWWIHAIGADAAGEPPGPGIWSVTDVDSGLDITHPEFAARLDTTLLNPQSTAETEEWHGTAVSSVAAAPANGIGVVGAYPQADFRMWDASPDGELTDVDEVRGILAAAAHGPTVINLSLGSDSRDPLETQAVLKAFGAGSLVVAASGNSKLEGDPLEFPAVLPHVLTAAASTELGAAASFSSSSSAVDITAPGVDMPVAVPTAVHPSQYLSADGTSFAAPLVSGAAAWVANMRPGLTVGQLFQLMRGSAIDIPPAGFDKDSGFGLLSIPAALVAPIPPVDPQEPNDDIPSVRAKGLFRLAKTPLINGLVHSAVIHATEDFTEDPEDVYRIVVPARRTVTITMAPTANLTLALWGPLTRTVFEDTKALVKRDLLSFSAKPGRSTEKLVFKNKLKRSTTLYLDVWIGSKLLLKNVSYTLKTSWR